jgi:hypothetical protein
MPKVGFHAVGVMRQHGRGGDGRFPDGLLMDLLRGELADDRCESFAAEFPLPLPGFQWSRTWSPACPSAGIIGPLPLRGWWRPGHEMDTAVG